MSWRVFDVRKDVEFLKKIHPKADVYFLRLAMVCGFLMVVQILFQITTAIGLIR